jgi:hypothetical protein
MGDFMGKGLVSIVVCLLLCASVITVAGTINTRTTTINGQKRVTDADHGIVWLGNHRSTPEKSLSEDTNWIHYDDGTCEYSYGLADGGYWVDEAIKLTPTELAGYTGAFVSLRVMHGDDLSCDYVAWMYKNADHPTADPLEEATIVASGTCPAVYDWFYINFTTPYSFNQTDTVWFGVGWHQMYGYTSPIGFDMDTYAAGKSDWTWSSENGATWLELSDCGFTTSWGLWVGIADDTTPPVTTLDLSGTMQDDYYVTPVKVTLTSTDDMSGVKSIMYQIDSEAWTTYSAPFVVSDEGTHTICYYSVDTVGNIEPTKTSTFTIQYTVKITIKGGIGITAIILNNGTTAMNTVSWRINLSGGHIYVGNNKTGSIDTIPAGKSGKAKDVVFGFGKIMITVTADGQTTTATGIVILCFVSGIK